VRRSARRATVSGHLGPSRIRLAQLRLGQCINLTDADSKTLDDSGKPAGHRGKRKGGDPIGRYRAGSVLEGSTTQEKKGRNNRPEMRWRG